jgi:hypothetical protein
MADSKQLRILKGLTAHLEGITPANGYEFDLTSSVYRGVTRFGADRPLPFVSILESLRPDPQPQEAGAERMTREDGWELLVQGWVDEDQNFPTDLLYQLKASVEKRVAEIVQEASPVYRLDRLIRACGSGRAWCGRPRRNRAARRRFICLCSCVTLSIWPILSRERAES